MVSTPKISVLMSVYNGEKYLKHSIKSILTQSFIDFEFIIVNDCSTDHSLEIITSFMDDRIVLINNKKNIGLTKSLNVGLDIAKGKYIARLDADDISFPERLKLQYEKMENGNFLMIGGWAIEVDDNFKVTRLLRPVSRCIDLRFKLLFSNTFIHSTVMFKREEVLKIGGYDTDYDYTQDYDLWSRISRIGQVGNLPVFLIYLRYDSLSISRVKAEEQNKIARQIARKNKSAISIQNLRLSEIAVLDDLYSGKTNLTSDQLTNPASLILVKQFCRYFNYTENQQSRILSQIYYRYLQFIDANLFHQKFYISMIFNPKLIWHMDNFKLFFVILIKKMIGKKMTIKVVDFLQTMKAKNRLVNSIKK